LGDITGLAARSQQYSTPREKQFLESCASRLSEGDSLTYSQERWADLLMGKYSEENIKEEVAWKESFGKEKRKIAYQVAEYYQFNPPYFANIVQTVLANPESFVLSRDQWKRFCENKYALKIRNLHSEPPKFQKSDCIQVRSRNKISLANRGFRTLRLPKPNHVGFVLEVDALPITRAAKGSRVYKILLTGESSPIYAHESDLKRKR
jgi:hypothetical protein